MHATWEGQARQQTYFIPNMRGFHWSCVGFWLQIAAFSSAIPTDFIPIARRSHVCANAPKTVAGTLLSRSVLPAPFTLSPRTSGNIVSSQIWCAAGSRTYVITTLKPAVASAAVLHLLDNAWAAVITHVNLYGDGLIPGGVFSWAGEQGAGLTMANANNHQLTWGVMGAALTALCEEMERLVIGSMGLFTIVDGDTEVGTGTIYDGWELP